MNYLISRDITSGTCKSDLLLQQIKASGTVSSDVSVSIAGDSLTVYCSSVSNQSGLDAVVLAHVAYPLSQAIADKCTAIDTKTQYIIAQGFAFDGNTFIPSAQSQIIWIAIMVLQASLSWPVYLITGSNIEYALTQDNVAGFLGAAIASAMAPIQSGRTLKLSVLACTTVAQVAAIVDSR